MLQFVRFTKHNSDDETNGMKWSGIKHGMQHVL
jgi:hypothetical protein